MYIIYIYLYLFNDRHHHRIQFFACPNCSEDSYQDDTDIRLKINQTFEYNVANSMHRWAYE